MLYLIFTSAMDEKRAKNADLERRLEERKAALAKHQQANAAADKAVREFGEESVGTAALIKEYSVLLKRGMELLEASLNTLEATDTEKKELLDKFSGIISNLSDQFSIILTDFLPNGRERDVALNTVAKLKHSTTQSLQLLTP